MNKHFQNITFLLLLTILGCGFSSCRHTDDPPPPPDSPEPGKRDYTWTVDTLAYPGSATNMMYAMWASSSKDVYVVGYSDTRGGKMYHYDGDRWSYIPLYIIGDGSVEGLFTLTSVYGFSKTDIYAAGWYFTQNLNPPPNVFDSSIVIHFDGTSWKEVKIRPRGRALTSVWGANANDIWVGGGEGTLFHYTDSTWKRMPTDERLFMNDFAGFAPNDVYNTCGRTLVDSTLGWYEFYLRHWDGFTWTVLDSFDTYTRNGKFGWDLYAGPNHTLYSAGFGAYKYNVANNTWEKIFANERYMNVAGSSNDNIYVVGNGAQIFHWNGTDWKSIPPLLGPQVGFIEAWTDNKETFIMGTDNSYSYVLHGK